jgi:outer membrane protein OmpA-like peptidoglycan-associated protein
MKKNIILLSLLLSIPVFAEDIVKVNPMDKDLDLKTVSNKTYVLGVNNTLAAAIATITHSLSDKLNGLSDVEREKYLLFKEQLNNQLQSDSLIQRIYFKTASSILSEDVLNYLTNVVMSLNDYKSLKYSLAGYSDNRGGSDYNYDLSMERVKAIKHVLLMLKVPIENIKVDNYGESLSQDKAVAEDYFFDRKVEIKISK